MTELTLDALTHKVLDYFQRHARRYQLTPSGVSAAYEPEQSGMDIYTFTIAEGKRKLTLRLGLGAETQLPLERWAFLSRRLSQDHHAPTLVDWVKIPGIQAEGILYEQPTGQALDLAQHPAELKEVLAALERLHADKDLARDLANLKTQEEGEKEGEEEEERLADLPYANLDCFLDGFIEAFDGDLVEIAENFPAFLSHAVDDWMMGETRELEGLAREMPSFDEPAETPIHGSVYPDVLRFEADGAWSLLAWESVDLGDPALDFALLLGSLWRGGALSVQQAVERLPGKESAEKAALAERFKLYLRAMLLEEVIDAAASWIEAEAIEGEDGEEVRRELEAAHKEALEMYRKMYG